MKRPLLLILYCLIGGILLEYRWNIVGQIAGCRPFGFAQDRFGSGAHLTIMFYGLLLCLWYVLYRFNSARLATFCLGIIAIVIGMTRYAATNQVPVQHISNFVKDEVVTIEGFLYQPPEFGISVSQNGFEKKQYLYVETTWLEQGKLRYRVCGKVRITLGDSVFPHPKPKTFAYGDVIRTRLYLYLPRNYDETGDFDYQEFLRRQGIYLVGYLRHDRYIIQLPGHQGNFLFTWMYLLRDQIIHFLDQYSSVHEHAAINHSSEAIQVIKAITLGASRELSPGVKEKFRNSGMYHLLVVSGIHIGILVWVVHQVLHIVHIPLHYRSIFLIVVLFLYTGLIGFQFPVLRATLMVLALYFSITCNRISDPLYSLAFSGCLILFIFPTALFDVSFQLTIAATTSILLLVRFLKYFAFWERVSRLPYLLRLLVTTFSMSVGAMIGISPLIVFYFQQLYPYSLASNLLALPVISLLLPLSLFSDILSLFAPWHIVYPLAAVNLILAKWLLFLAGLFPEFEVILPRPAPIMLVIYYIAVYCGLSFYRRNEKMGRT